MDDISDPITRAALEAAKALRTMGWPVLACVDGEGAWRIRDAILTNDELVSFAIWAMHPTSNGKAGSVVAETCRDPHAPLDAAEALECIRAVIGVVKHCTGEEEAVAFRLIRAIVRKAPRLGAASAILAPSLNTTRTSE